MSVTCIPSMLFMYRCSKAAQAQAHGHNYAGSSPKLPLTAHHLQKQWGQTATCFPEAYREHGCTLGLAVAMSRVAWRAWLQGEREREFEHSPRRRRTSRRLRGTVALSRWDSACNAREISWVEHGARGTQWNVCPCTATSKSQE